MKHKGKKPPFKKQKNNASSKKKEQKRNNFSLHETQMIYGLHACEAAFKNDSRHIKKIYITKDHPFFKESFFAQAQTKNITIETLTKFEIDNIINNASAVHQNILLHVEPLVAMSLEEVIKQHGGEETSYFILLDQVNDPHNIGAILRSACVFGAHGIIVQDKNAPNMNATICKIACGASEITPYIKETNLSRSLEILQRAGYWCLGMDEWGEKPLKESLKGIKKVVLVMGAEGPGLRDLIKKNCDELTKLHTSNELSSLNVSNAAAIALYETFETLKFT